MNIEQKRNDSSVLLSILLFLILFSPTRNQTLKLIVIVAIFVFLFFQTNKNSLRISKKILYWFLIYLVLNSVFLAMGGFKNPIIVGQLGPLKLIWPMLYFFSFIFFTSLNKVSINFDRLFFYSSIVIPAFLLVTFYFDALPTIFTSIFPYTRTYYAGFIDYFSPAITSLFFLGTYSISRVISNKEKQISKFIIPTLLILWTSFVIGRRALLLLIFSAPILYLLLLLITKKIN